MLRPDCVDSSHNAWLKDNFRSDLFFPQPLPNFAYVIESLFCCWKLLKVESPDIDSTNVFLKVQASTRNRVISNNRVNNFEFFSLNDTVSDTLSRRYCHTKARNINQTFPGYLLSVVLIWHSSPSPLLPEISSWFEVAYIF